MERCPYCFKPLPESGICDCNYEESENARIEDALHPGSIVGACYQIGAVLGKGGFGITYRAFDLNMQKVVAVKEFYPDGMATRAGLRGNLTQTNVTASDVIVLTQRNSDVYRKSLELFYREAIALGKLERLPNVVHAHHIFRENGTAYIVMEFVEGKSLKKIVEERGRIPEEELIPLLDPALTALQKVHKSGILHRDIAPDNIMIEDSSPVLLDFGAARVQDDGHHSSLLVGKKGFSSPEQMAGETLDERSDIYSLGATYYRALSGMIPQDSVTRMFGDKVVPLNELAANISPHVSDAVMKAMALKPDDRWTSVSEFQKALNGEIGADAVKEKQTGAAEIPGSDTEPQKGGTGSAGPSVLIPPHKKKLPLIPITVLLVMAAAALFLFRDKIIPSPEPTADIAALTQAALENTQTAAVREQMTQEAKQTETAGKATRDALSAEQTATSWTAAREAELRQTETQNAVNISSTQEFLQSRTEEASLVETQQALSTRAVLESAQTATAWFATQQTELRQTQTQSAENLKNTQAVQEQQTAQAALTQAAFESTQEAMNASLTQIAATRSAIIAEQTKSAMTQTQDAVYLKETKAAETQAVYNAAQTKAAEPTVTSTPKPTVDVKGLVELGKAALQAYDYKNALEYMSLAAEAGDADAQYHLGFMYYYGDGVTKSLEKAAEWYKKAADQGQASAQYNLGYMYENGLGVKKSYEGAFEWYQKAAGRGNASAQLSLGILYEKGLGVQQSYEKAAEWYKKAADQGNSAAQAKMNLLSAKTLRLTETADAETLTEQGKAAYQAGDYAKALEFLAPAAEAGNMMAQNNLGVMYSQGQGVDVSPDKAAEWFQKSAEQGYAEAQYNLGTIYYFGVGVSQSYDKAFEWFQKAAGQGYAAAQYNLGWMYENGEGVQRSYDTALEWYRKAAGNGSESAKSKLNTLNGSVNQTAADDAQTNLEQGEAAYKAADYKKALEYMIPAAEAGNMRAQDYLGVMYYLGQGTDASVDKAAEWFKKSADQGYADAQHNLGRMYYFGEGVGQSYADAFALFQKAADQGYAAAQYNLGQMYEHGEGVQQSLDKAVEWYRKAAVQGNESAISRLNSLAGAGAGQSSGTSGQSSVPAGLKAGDIIKFGGYEQDNDLSNNTEPIEWQVLTVEKNRALLVSVYGLDTKPYHDTVESITWEKCTLRKWLNEDFLEKAFTQSEKSRILEVTNDNPGNGATGIRGGNPTKDKVFLLSLDEIKKYLGSDEARKCTPTEYAKKTGKADIIDDTSPWWLRSPGLGEEWAASVFSWGLLMESDGILVIGSGVVVRPALWLEIS